MPNATARDSSDAHYRHAHRAQCRGGRRSDGVRARCPRNGVASPPSPQKTYTICPMPTPFDTLRKILQNESSRGYDNKGMIGGLDKYVPVLEQQARTAGVDAAVLDEIIGLMKNYGSLAPENRPDAVKALLAQLPQSAPAPQPIRTAPPEREKEREKERE